MFLNVFLSFWPDCPYEIYLVSNFKEYKSNKVNSIKIGEDKDYGTNLKNIVKHIPTEWFVLWIDDAIFSKKR